MHPMPMTIVSSPFSAILATDLKEAFLCWVPGEKSKKSKTVGSIEAIEILILIKCKQKGEDRFPVKNCMWFLVRNASLEVIVMLKIENQYLLIIECQNKKKWNRIQSSGI